MPFASFSGHWPNKKQILIILGGFCRDFMENKRENTSFTIDEERHNKR